MSHFPTTSHYWDMVLKALILFSFLSLSAIFQSVEIAHAAECNPVTQAGCLLQEKCGQFVESTAPFTAIAACVPNGTALRNEACTIGEAPDAWDDCTRGLVCVQGVCKEACSRLPTDTCATDQVCTLYQGLFSDFNDTGGAGVCEFICDPIAQDCPSGACFINLASLTSSCGPVPAGAVGHIQGDACYGPEGGGCFNNGCEGGFAPFLPNPKGGGAVCTFLCNPIPTYQGSSCASSGDPQRVNCGSVFADRENGPGGNYECRFVDSFYAISRNTGLGQCVARSEFESCRDFDLSRYEQFLDDTNIASYNAFCEANPASCALGCVPEGFRSANSTFDCDGTTGMDAGVTPGDSDAGVTPDETGEEGTEASGCGCRTSGGSKSGALALLLITMAILGRRRLHCPSCS